MAALSACSMNHENGSNAHSATGKASEAVGDYTKCAINDNGIISIVLYLAALNTLYLWYIMQMASANNIGTVTS